MSSATSDRSPQRSFTTFVEGGHFAVLLLSLTDQEKRRKDLVDRSVPVHWVDNYFPAIDARNATMADLVKWADIDKLSARIGGAPLPAEIGCALSHRAAAQWLCQSGQDLALVLEDDIVPACQEWTEVVTALARSFTMYARQGASFVCLLGAPEDQTQCAFKRKVHWLGSEPLTKMPDVYLLSDPHREVWRSHAYLISRAAAERTTEAEAKIQLLADDWRQRQAKGMLDRVFFTNPRIVYQDEAAPSTIRSRERDRDAHEDVLSAVSDLARSRSGAEIYSLRRVFASASYRLARIYARINSRRPFKIYAGSPRSKI